MPDYIPPIYDAVLLRPGSEDNGLNHFAVTVQMITGRKRSPRHWHDYFQIWYTLAGEYTQQIEDCRLPLASGSMVVLPPYTEHLWDTSDYCDGERSIVCIRIRKDAGLPLYSLARGKGAFDAWTIPLWHTFSGEEKEKVQSAVKCLTEEANRKAGMSQEKVKCLTEKLLRFYGETAGVPVDSRQLQKERLRMESMEKAAVFIRERHRQDISVDQIAEYLHISRRSLTETFFRHMGRTVHGYIMAERMRSAYHCLRTTTESVDAIARRCGFANSSHFSAAFRKAFGCTPLRFRKAVCRWQKKYGDAEFRMAIEEMRWFTEPTEQSLINHYTSMSFE